MNTPVLNWPLPWWTIAVVVVVIVCGTWLAAKLSTRDRNRLLLSLGPKLMDEGVSADTEAFSVGDAPNAVVISRGQIGVIDVRDTRVIQVLPLREVSALKIYEDRSDRIRFRMITRRGGRTREVSTHSIVDFAALFTTLTRAGKPLEYVQE